MTEFEKEVLRLLTSIDDRLKVVEDEAGWLKAKREVKSDELRRLAASLRPPTR